MLLKLVFTLLWFCDACDNIVEIPTLYDLLNDIVGNFFPESDLSHSVELFDQSSSTIDQKNFLYLDENKSRVSEVLYPKLL